MLLFITFYIIPLVVCLLIFVIVLKEDLKNFRKNPTAKMDLIHLLIFLVAAFMPFVNLIISFYFIRDMYNKYTD